ncbi:MAG: metallophosphoesterase [Verrucomicrobiia bacterium]
MKTNVVPRFVVWLSALLLSAPSLRADWFFAMLGDTRGTGATTTNGVSPYLNTIAQKIATLSPELVLVAGDLVNGNDVPSGSPLENYAVQFANWKTAMQPVYNYASNTGIPIYPVRGNHENNDSEGAPVVALKQAYYDAFSAYVPLNGPNYGSTNNQVGFSYSFTTNNVTFVAADQYFYYDLTPGMNGYHDLDRAWVTQQFQQTNSAYEIFMAHEPFFMTAGHESDEHFFGSHPGGFQTREDFWNALGTNGVQLYLTGHVHNETVASITNDYGNTIIQLMAGNGGAPSESLGDIHDPGVEVLYTNALFGFSLATVQADAMTIQYYSLHTNDNSWTVASYITSISPNQAVPEASSAILLAPALIAVMAGRFRKRRRSEC